jgi:Ser/Thr protein kinase RdoA (MazF antagonist)
VRPEIQAEALARVVDAYPHLGTFGAIARNGLSINTAACLFTTDRGTYFAKRDDPAVWDVEALAAEHGIIRRLVAAGYPTPRLYENVSGETITWLDRQPYALFDRARGEDRYGDAPVFAPYGSPAEAEAAGAMLARFHAVFAGEPLPAPKPIRGLTVRFQLLSAPSVAEGMAGLLEEAPVLKDFLRDRPELPRLLERLEHQRLGLAPWLGELPRGVIHGDFIKRNLFWEGDRVVDVLDFDLWNVGYMAHDLALALLPTGFDWPALLAGGDSVNGRDMAAMLAGYETVRPLTHAERQALPWLMESGRFEFYLSAVVTAIGRGQVDQAEAFWRLLVGVYDWFAAHPGWRTRSGLS